MLRVGLALWLLLCAGACRAQVAGSVGVVSDYRYRGMSLSDGRPAVQLSIDRDFAAGTYAGLMLSSVRLRDQAGSLPRRGAWEELGRPRRFTALRSRALPRRGVGWALIFCGRDAGPDNRG